LRRYLLCADAFLAQICSNCIGADFGQCVVEGGRAARFGMTFDNDGKLAFSAVCNFRQLVEDRAARLVRQVSAVECKSNNTLRLNSFEPQFTRLRGFLRALIAAATAYYLATSVVFFASASARR
jgi:hypothetical protein